MRHSNGRGTHKTGKAIGGFIGHSHSIVRLHNNYLIFLIKIFIMFWYAAQHAVKNSRY